MAVLTKKSVTRTLLSMAVPMLGGTIAMNAFNLADTLFVSRLGTVPLAAMGFSFPVIMLIITFVRGIGVGGTTLVSHTIGASNHKKARHITTHTLLLAFLMTLFFCIIGLLTIEPVFLTLGAEPETMPLIKEYMTVWYIGIFFLVIPMIGNDILRGTGDFINPSLMMVFACVVNIILDPIMIFGYFGCPAMGIKGAAIATVISRALTCIWVIYVITAKHNLISISSINWKEIKESWINIGRIAIPITLGTMLMPIASGIITRLTAGFGVDAVAATSAASRVEMFAFMIPMALGMSLMPFIGQNFGANRMDRVHEGKNISYRFALIIGAFIAVLFISFAPYIASIFTKDPEVADILTKYLWIIPAGYGMMEVHRYSGFFMTGINRPIHASIVNIIRIVILVVLSLIGAAMGNIIWLFAARVISDIIAGGIGIIYSNIILNRTETTLQKKQSTASC